MRGVETGRLWMAAVLRFFKKKLVLAFIFSLSLIYCIASFLHEVNSQRIISLMKSSPPLLHIQIME